MGLFILLIIILVIYYASKHRESYTIHNVVSNNDSIAGKQGKKVVLDKKIINNVYPRTTEEVKNKIKEMLFNETLEVYQQHKTIFDYILENDEYLAIPKIEILLNDIKVNSIIKDYEVLEKCIIKCIDLQNVPYLQHLPYYCYTDEELEWALRDEYILGSKSVNAVENLVFYYGYMNKNKTKALYWKRILEDMAKCNNFEAQALLANKRATVGCVYSEEERKVFYEMYHDSLAKKMDDGDYGAMLAIAKHGLDKDSDFLPIGESHDEFKEKLLSVAAYQGNLSDAFYELGEFYRMLIRYDNFEERPEPLTGEESYELLVKSAQCFLNGAYLNNGSNAALCQVECYRGFSSYDDEGFGHDDDAALNMLLLAMENGLNYFDRFNEYKQRIENRK